MAAARSRPRCRRTPPHADDRAAADASPRDRSRPRRWPAGSPRSGWPACGYDLVAGAQQHQGRRLQLRCHRPGPRTIRSTRPAIGVDPRLAQIERVAAECAQHLDIVRRHALGLPPLTRICGNRWPAPAARCGRPGQVLAVPDRRARRIKPATGGAVGSGIAIIVTAHPCSRRARRRARRDSGRALPERRRPARPPRPACRASDRDRAAHRNPAGRRLRPGSRAWARSRRTPRSTLE